MPMYTVATACAATKLRARLVDLVDRADVGMIERRGRSRFTAKSLERLRVEGQRIRHELQRDRTAQSRVFGLVHHAHSTAAQLLDDVVVRDAATNHRRVRERCRIKLSTTEDTEDTEERRVEQV